MTFGSLFAGIGGFDLGFERAGMRCVWQVEIDDWCRRVLAKHWPDVPKWDDVRTFTGDGFERPDVICGGFPCQDLSRAGKKIGIGGKRSGLWAEFSRIIRLVRPRFVVVENVAGLSDGGIGVVLGDLAACGYDAEWDGLPACEFGASTERDRTFVVAYPTSLRQPEPRVFRKDAYCIETAVGWETTDALDAIRRSAVPALCGSASRIPCRMDRLTGLGNAVVPQVSEWIGRRLMESP